MNKIIRYRSGPLIGANRSQHLRCPRKPDFEPLVGGTVFLWDVANLFGRIGPEDAAWRLESISRSLEAQGYRSLFFIERRALTWAKHNQLTAADVAALGAFARRGDFSIVADGCREDRSGEADCAILQVAEAIPNSICVSYDHYIDYAKAHPGIVGTGRIRSFTVSRLEGNLVIAVNGLTRAIVVEPQQKGIMDEFEVGLVSGQSEIPFVELGVDERRTGLLAVAAEYVRRGDVRNAERVYAKMARKDPAAYDALADLYCEGQGVRPDAKKAARFERLARESKKCRVERELRDRRVRARAYRAGRSDLTHFASKRRKALSLATFSEVHETICDYFSGTQYGRMLALGTRGNAA